MSTDGKDISIHLNVFGVSVCVCVCNFGASVCSQLLDQCRAYTDLINSVSEHLKERTRESVCV